MYFDFSLDPPVINQRKLSYHECTEEDFAQYYPMNDELKGELADGRPLDDKMFCIDDTKEPIGFNSGFFTSGTVRTLYFAVEPCNRVNNFFTDLKMTLSEMTVLEIKNFKKSTLKQQFLL